MVFFSLTGSLRVSFLWTAFDIKQVQPCVLVTCFLYIVFLSPFLLSLTLSSHMLWVAQHQRDVCLFPAWFQQELQVCLHRYHTCFLSITGLNAINVSTQAWALPDFVGGRLRSVLASDWREESPYCLGWRDPFHSYVLLLSVIFSYWKMPL